MTPLSVSHKVNYYIAIRYLGCTHMEPNLDFKSIQTVPHKKNNKQGHYKFFLQKILSLIY